jgi:hypothetical protein
MMSPINSLRTVHRRAQRKVERLKSQIFVERSGRSSTPGSHAKGACMSNTRRWLDGIHCVYPGHLNSRSRLPYQSNIPETCYPVLPTPFVEHRRLILEKRSCVSAHNRTMGTAHLTRRQSALARASGNEPCFLNRLYSSVTVKYHSTLVIESLQRASAQSVAAQMHPRDDTKLVHRAFAQAEL